MFGSSFIHKNHSKMVKMGGTTVTISFISWRPFTALRFLFDKFYLFSVIREKERNISAISIIPESGVLSPVNFLDTKV